MKKKVANYQELETWWVRGLQRNFFFLFVFVISLPVPLAILLSPYPSLTTVHKKNIEKIESALRENPLCLSEDDLVIPLKGEAISFVFLFFFCEATIPVTSWVFN